ncbi:Dnase i-like superfamily protein [Thalictrum thalictroides]|uniref:Dnase i-like superfamily protein n=1 Tax=Thalictrum thalictroides TaxID=46969 RepID=A0A7J6WHY7_THATH|nr:Dnase i-like superfamily protein [Thalictrum thalictroides]
MGKPICMWDCLNVSGEVEKKQKEPKIDEKKKTFAEKVREEVAMVDLSTMPKPGMKGNIPTIKIPRKSLERGLNYYFLHTLERDYGFFASVLVEIDLSKPIPNQILVEEEGGKDFVQEVELGKLPSFCGHCKTVEEEESEEEVEETEKVADVEDNGVSEDEQSDQEQIEAEQTSLVLIPLVDVGKKLVDHDSGDVGNPIEMGGIVIELSNASPKENGEHGRMSDHFVETGERVIETQLSPQREERALELITIPHRADVIKEAQAITNSSGWKDIVEREEGEWQTPKKKHGGKAKGVMSEFSPPHTRARTLEKDPSMMERHGYNNYVENNRDGRTGNLWVFMKDGVDAHVVHSDDQQITLRIGDSGISFVHAKCFHPQRRSLWETLKIVGASFRSWMVVGDFNADLFSTEKKGGRSPGNVAMREFNSFMNENALVDVTRLGLKYSWCNRRKGKKRIFAKLDRMLVNQEFLQNADGWKSKILQRKFSDHSPIVGWNTKIPKPRNIPFRCKRCWFDHARFFYVVRKSWEEQIITGPINLMVQKLKRLKKVLKLWNKETFWGKKEKIRKLDKEIKIVQQKLQEDFSNDELQDLEYRLEKHRNQAIDIDLSLWKQKACEKQMLEGERNSNFFQAKVKMRQSKTFIVEIEDEQGELHRDQERIKDYIVAAYTKNFQRVEVEVQQQLIYLVPRKLDEEDNNLLCAIPDMA